MQNISITKDNRIKEFGRIMEMAGFVKPFINSMISKLDTLGFFTAPASIKYHGAYEGGLYDHCVEVTEQLLNLTEKLELKWEHERSPFVVGMFHDLCKCDSYKCTLDDFTKYAFNKDTLLNGHGEKSVILAQGLLIQLTQEEIACIRWHMGAFDDKENWGYYNYAISQYPNVLYTHTADMIASAILNT